MLLRIPNTIYHKEPIIAFLANKKTWFFVVLSSICQLNPLGAWLTCFSEIDSVKRHVQLRQGIPRLLRLFWHLFWGDVYIDIYIYIHMKIYPYLGPILLMEEILHQLIGGLSPYTGLYTSQVVQDVFYTHRIHGTGILPTQTRHCYKVESPQHLHIFALFDLPPKWVPI